MKISEAFKLYSKHVLERENRSLKTINNYMTAMRNFVRLCDDIDVTLITNSHITYWKQKREEYGQKSSYVAHDIVKMRLVLKWLKTQHKDVIDADTIRVPKVHRTIGVYLEHSEVDQLLSVIVNPRDLSLYTMYYESGARLSELIQLNRDSVRIIQDAKGRFGAADIIGKNSQPGTLFFNERSLEAMEDYLSTRRDKLRPMFVTSQNRRISISTVNKNLHLYEDLAGLDKNVTPKVLRHSFATDLERNGANIFEIQAALRHANIATTQIYVHPRKDLALQANRNKRSY